jgi:hypothetical protein
MAPTAAQNVDTSIPTSGGYQEIASLESGQPAVHPQEYSENFALPDVFAIRIDPAIVNQKIDQLLAGLDAIVSNPFDQVDQESFWVRLGYWVIAVSGTAVSFELVRGDLRNRRPTRVEIRTLNGPLPQDNNDRDRWV